MIIRRARAHARHDDQIIPARDLPLMQAINLPQTAADAVAHDGMADFVGHGVADAAAAGAYCVQAYDALSGLVSFEKMKKKMDSGWKKTDI